MLQAYAYVLHLLTGFVLVAVFFGIYTRITPFDELALIHKGNVAAALSLSGAMFGFCLTVASSILHNATYGMFVVWSIGAMIVQVVCYAVITRTMPEMEKAIEGNNAAMGGLMGAASIAIGIVTAACIS